MAAPRHSLNWHGHRLGRIHGWISCLLNKHDSFNELTTGNANACAECKWFDYVLLYLFFGVHHHQFQESKFLHVKLLINFEHLSHSDSLIIITHIKFELHFGKICKKQPPGTWLTARKPTWLTKWHFYYKCDLLRSFIANLQPGKHYLTLQIILYFLRPKHWSLLPAVTMVINLHSTAAYFLSGWLVDRQPSPNQSQVALLHHPSQLNGEHYSFLSVVFFVCLTS